MHAHTCLYRSLTRRLIYKAHIFEYATKPVIKLNYFPLIKSQLKLNYFPLIKSPKHCLIFKYADCGITSCYNYLFLKKRFLNKCSVLLTYLINIYFKIIQMLAHLWAVTSYYYLRFKNSLDSQVLTRLAIFLNIFKLIIAPLSFAPSHCTESNDDPTIFPTRSSSSSSSSCSLFLVSPTKKSVNQSMQLKPDL